MSNFELTDINSLEESNRDTSSKRPGHCCFQWSVTILCWDALENSKSRGLSSGNLDNCWNDPFVDAPEAKFSNDASHPMEEGFILRGAIRAEGIIDKSDLDSLLGRCNEDCLHRPRTKTSDKALGLTKTIYIFPTGTGQEPATGFKGSKSDRSFRGGKVDHTWQSTVKTTGPGCCKGVRDDGASC